MMKNLRGQSLFEVIVALTVVGFIMVGLVQVATLSIRNTTFTKNKARANIYATELIEWLRGQRDTKWTDFKANFNANNTYCFKGSSLNWSQASACGSSDVITGTTFKRSALFTCYPSGTSPLPAAVACSGNNVVLIQAVTTITWVDGNVTHKIDIITNLTNSKSN